MINRWSSGRSSAATVRVEKPQRVGKSRNPLPGGDHESIPVMIISWLTCSATAVSFLAWICLRACRKVSWPFLSPPLLHWEELGRWIGKRKKRLSIPCKASSSSCYLVRIPWPSRKRCWRSRLAIWNVPCRLWKCNQPKFDQSWVETLEFSFATVHYCR